MSTCFADLLKVNEALVVGLVFFAIADDLFAEDVFLEAACCWIKRSLLLVFLLPEFVCC